ncbi:MAG: NAD(P)H-dependent oxidoreductase [Burkholderiales bacterium]|nr:NAD(P)H-dependent oxidoreductase [Burkholderiales bacterium]
MTYNVGLVIGSLRRESSSRRIAELLPSLAPGALQFRELAIGDLPLYNGDLEAQTPPPWQRLRAEVLASDALLFVSPEYNRSVPGGLKNAIDIGSKPTASNVWARKPAFVITQATGMLGGLAGSYALKQVLAAVNVATLPHPEIYLSRIATLFDGEGRLAADTQDLLRGALATFEAWIARFVPRRQP